MVVVGAQGSATAGYDEHVTASVTASGTFERVHRWSIEKSVDSVRRTVGPGGTAKFTYAVVVRAEPIDESGWRARGAVTVVNHDGRDGVTADVTVDTDLHASSTCVVMDGEDAAVPAGGQRTFSYTCSFDSAPTASAAATATVSWKTDGSTTRSSVLATTPVAFAATETDKTVEVVDDRTVPGQRVVLAPALSWAAGLEESYTYSLELPNGPAGECATYTNTATVEPTGTYSSPGPIATDTATVTVCAPPVAPPPPPPAAAAAPAAPAAGRDAPGRDAPGRDAPGRDAAGRDAAGRDAAGRDAAGRDHPTTGPARAGLRQGGRDGPSDMSGNGPCSTEQQVG